jgi:hypothetical protein
MNLHPEGLEGTRAAPRIPDFGALGEELVGQAARDRWATSPTLPPAAPATRPGARVHEPVLFTSPTASPISLRNAQGGPR